MKTIKRVGNAIKTQDYKPKNKESLMLQLIKANGGNGYYRKGNFSTELVWDKKSYMFPSDNNYKS